MYIKWWLKNTRHCYKIEILLSTLSLPISKFENDGRRILSDTAIVSLLALKFINLIYSNSLRWFALLILPFLIDFFWDIQIQKWWI